MKLILLLIPLILLSSCTIDWNGDRLFEKKRYCSELKTDGEKTSEIYQKFYSPKRDTCIYYTIEGTSHRVYDALTKEYITGISSSSTDLESYRTFENELKKLKGE